MVSIHAPVKDATIASCYLFVLHFVSIHAPVKDATEAGSVRMDVFKFQSTHP